MPMLAMEVFPFLLRKDPPFNLLWHPTHPLCKKPHYKNPLLSLILRFSPPSSGPPPFPVPLRFRLPFPFPLANPLVLPPHSPPPPPQPPPPPAFPPLSIRNPFHPSNSLSNLNAFSFSSRKSRSALLATNWLLASSACNSSTIWSSRSILSRPLATSSERCWACLSRRDICACRSRTVRSTLRTERREVACLDSCASSCCSSCVGRKRTISLVYQRMNSVFQQGKARKISGWPYLLYSTIQKPHVLTGARVAFGFQMNHATM